MKNKIMICDYCGKSFTTKFSLKRHIISIHLSGRRKGKIEDTKSTNRYFQCNECLRKLRTKYALKRHTYIIHQQPLRKIKPSQLKCLICSKVFILRRILNEHYQQEHRINFEFEDHNFDTLADFEKWLKARYVMSTTWVTSDFIIRKYRCHRSGHYIDQCKLKNRKRQRFLKLGGTKKLQGHCPAEVTLKQQRHRPEGSCVAHEQKTHVGHSIADLGELKHLYLPKEEKKKIALQLKMKVPKERILKDIYVNFVPDEDNRKNSIDKMAASETVDHVASDEFLFEDPFVVENEADDYIESFVEQHNDVVLFYKGLNRNDTVFNLFECKDFVLVLQYKCQRECLRKYGHKMVAFDATLSSSPYNFLLHTMLVTDIENEAIPVAFLLSNRCDKCAIDVFIRSVRENVGVVQTKTLLSDLNSAYHEVWCDVMGAPIHSLYCTWHVRKVWRHQLTKFIPEMQSQRSSSLRKELKAELYDMADELDETSFLNKLTAFVTKEDPPVQPFLEYFRQNYASAGKEKLWAFCYRLNAGLNYCSMRVQSFHRTMKYVIAGGKKIRTLSRGLWLIDEYIKHILYKEELKLVKPKIPLKLRELRKKHILAEESDQKEESSFSIEFIEDGVWQVGSVGDAVEGVMEMYVIRQAETKECSLYADECCGLVCEPCERCFHEFFCSCHDNAIASNMCKHIHALGIFLKNRRNSSSEDITEDTITVENVTLLGDNSTDVILNERIHDEIDEKFRHLADIVKSYVTPSDTRVWREIESNFLKPMEPALRSLFEVRVAHIEKPTTEMILTNEIVDQQLISIPTNQNENGFL